MQRSSRSRQSVVLSLICLSGTLIACAGGGGGGYIGPVPDPGSDGPDTGGRKNISPARRFALLVGVGKYGDLSGQMTDLRYSETDVESLAGVLQTGGYAAADTRIMTVNAGRGSPLFPTAANILAQLQSLLAQCTAEDVVLVAFTGHGLLSNGISYFCPHGASRNDASTLVNLEEVQRRIAASEAGTRLLVCDACRELAGVKAPPGSRPPAPGNLPTVSGKPRTAMITYFSCSPSEYSWESDQLQHGVFFGHLIDGLGGKADLGGDGSVTWEGLAGYINQQVRSYGDANPDRRQTPHFKGDVAGAKPLVVRAPTRREPSPSNVPDGTKGPPAVAVTRTIELNKKLDIGDPRIDASLVRIEFRADRRMRWHFSLWNQSARQASLFYWIWQRDCYITDQSGNRSDPVEDSHRNTGIDLPEGQKLNIWIDFQAPFPDARLLTARFPSGRVINLPQINVDLGQGTATAANEAPSPPPRGAAGRTPEGAGSPKDGKGALVLKSGTPVGKDVKAWVEVEGKRYADFPEGATEVPLNLAAGKYRVTVHMTFRNRTVVIFDRVLDVIAGEKATVFISQ